MLTFNEPLKTFVTSLTNNNYQIKNNLENI